MEPTHSRVIALTVTYGERWKFLSHVVEAVMKEKHVTKLVIVDNGSKNNEEIVTGTRAHGDRVAIIRLEKNLGSAGGFAVGLEYVRDVDADYVLLLDDDNVPEEGAIEIFLKQIQKIGKEKVVVVGNRVDIPGNEDIFYTDEQRETEPKGTFFEVLSFKKIAHYLALARGKELEKRRVRVTPHERIANESFVYGGAFIPMGAVRNAPLPDKHLILYGDDIEYSWGIKHLGYESYVCHEPKIHDIDMSFGEGSQAVGVMSPETLPFRTYYRIRNMVLISRRNTTQGELVLFINIVLWIAGLIAIGLMRYGIGEKYLMKVGLVVRAAWAGYFPRTPVPSYARLP